jgi:hypothetical protein
LRRWWRPSPRHSRSIRTRCAGPAVDAPRGCGWSGVPGLRSLSPHQLRWPGDRRAGLGGRLWRGHRRPLRALELAAWGVADVGGRAHFARNVEGLVTRGGDSTRTGGLARSMYRSPCSPTCLHSWTSGRPCGPASTGHRSGWLASGRDRCAKVSTACGWPSGPKSKFPCGEASPV